MEKGQDGKKADSGQRLSYTGYLIVLFLVAIAGALVTGSVIFYIQYIKTVQSLPRHIVSDHQVYDPDRYYTGKLTFTDRESGQVKDVTQEVFMDDRRREQILHIPGDKMDIYILQKFSEGKQMAVVFHTNASTPEGSVVMCTDAPLEGDYVSNMHLHNADGQNMHKDMKVAENFQPATHFLEFNYRTCADIPKDMFSSEVNNASVDTKMEESQHSRKKREVPYGGWCGRGNSGLGLPCCSGCNADFQTCVSRRCSPLVDQVDDSCFIYKMCEACTSQQQSGLPSCFCVKDFSNDLERSRCRSNLGASLTYDIRSTNSFDHPGHSSSISNVVDNAANAVADQSVVSAQLAAAEPSSSQYPSDFPVPLLPASDVATKAAGFSAINSVNANIMAAAEAQANAELQATIADFKMEQALSSSTGGRFKRQVGSIFYDRRACLRYRSRTLTELMHQRCWCPVYIRVQYVCGYQQVAGSCKVSNAGEKCAVKYQTCNRIMSKNTLNAVNYQKCPSIP